MAVGTFALVFPRLRGKMRGADADDMEVWQIE